MQSNQGGASSNSTAVYTTVLPKQAIANGEGITNGLRRLLHLSASEYLNLKIWNVSVNLVFVVSALDQLGLQSIESGLHQQFV